MKYIEKNIFIFSKKEQSTSELCNNFKWSSICVLESCKKGLKGGTENI